MKFVPTYDVLVFVPVGPKVGGRKEADGRSLADKACVCSVSPPPKKKKRPHEDHLRTYLSVLQALYCPPKTFISFSDAATGI